MLSDIADTIFNIDSRIFRTLFPLYFRPGCLSNEYFSGRRVRYVTPFRLYFFLSIAAFLLIQVSLDSFNPPNMIVIDTGAGNSISDAKTAQQVVMQRDAALASLNTAKDIPFVPSVAIDNATRDIQASAERRLAQLKDAKQSAPATTAADSVVAPTPKPKGQVRIGNAVWDPQLHPIHFGWLPEFANKRVNDAAIRLHDNLPRIKKNPRPFLVGTLGVLPGVLFVLMPLFALMLKIFYIFKRRLYMEHLIVALNSHSFIFVSLMLLTLAGLIKIWANTAAPWLADRNELGNFSDGLVDTDLFVAYAEKSIQARLDIDRTQVLHDRNRLYRSDRRGHRRRFRGQPRHDLKWSLRRRCRILGHLGGALRGRHGQQSLQPRRALIGRLPVPCATQCMALIGTKAAQHLAYGFALVGRNRLQQFTCFARTLLRFRTIHKRATLIRRHLRESLTQLLPLRRGKTVKAFECMPDSLLPIRRQLLKLRVTFAQMRALFSAQTVPPLKALLQLVALLRRKRAPALCIVNQMLLRRWRQSIPFLLYGCKHLLCDRTECRPWRNLACRYWRRRCNCTCHGGRNQRQHAAHGNFSSQVHGCRFHPSPSRSWASSQA